MLRGRASKILVFLLCLSPLGALGWNAWTQDLTANPIEYITRYTGTWTLRLIAGTLAITPLRRLLRQPDLIRFRRMIGLFAFFYGVLHLITYIWLDKFFEWPEMMKDIVKRPFITAGFASFVLMVPLALTSTRGWIGRLGGKRWQLLHRVIYGSAIAGVIHYFWLVKSDTRLPILYGTLVGILLLFRIAAWAVGRARRAKPALSGSAARVGPAPGP